MDLYKLIKNIILFGCLLGFMVIFDPMMYKSFGSFSWFLLVIIVFIRPLSEILPKIDFFKKIVGIRKQLGIMCGIFALAHAVGYFLVAQLGFVGIFSSDVWTLRHGLIFGMIAVIFLLPVLLTSNVYSMKTLGNNWKNVQRFTYIFFIFTALHLIFAKPMEAASTIFILIAWAIVWILAYKKVYLWK